MTLLVLVSPTLILLLGLLVPSNLVLWRSLVVLGLTPRFRLGTLPFKIALLLRLLLTLRLLAALRL